MDNKFKILIAGLLIALLAVGVYGATNAYAQNSGSLWQHGRGPMMGGGHGFGMGQAELDAAAKVLKMTSAELKTALQSGSTLQDLADKAGVKIEDVQAAMQAAHVQEMRDDINQAVKDGTITKENGDWLLEGLDKGFIGVPGADFGMGFGGHHKAGGWFGPNNQTNP